MILRAEGALCAAFVWTTLLCCLSGAAISAQAKGEPGEVSLPIEATVVDTEGRPVVGAGVAIAPIWNLRTADALDNPVVRSDAQGRIRWTFRHRPKPGQSAPVFHILVAKRGMTSIRGYLGVFRNAETNAPRTLPVRKLGEFRLMAGGVLRGRVRGAGGRPVAGARVFALELLSMLQAGQQLGRGVNGLVHAGLVLTDAKGRFELPCTLPEGVHLQVNAGGYFESQQEFVSSHRAVDISLTPSGFAAGQVVDENGKPMPAVIRLSSETFYYSQNRIAEPLATDAEGRFRISLSLRGRYRISASPFQNKFGVARTVQSPTYAFPRDDIRLEFEAGEEDELKPLPVLVKAKKDGAAVAGAMVGVLWQDLKSINGIALRNALRSAGQRTNEKGAAECPPPRGRQPYTGGLLATAAGFAPGIVKKIEYDDEKPPEIEVELLVESAVAGKVVDAATGAAVAGAKVMVTPVGLSGGESEFGMGFGLSVNYGYGSSGNQEPQAVSDAEGAFRVGQLAAGDYEVRAVLRGRPPSETQVVKLTAEALRKGVRIEIPTGQAWAGRLVAGYDDQDEPVPAKIPPGWQLTCGASTGNPGYYTRYSPFGYYETVPRERADTPTSELGTDGTFRFDGLAPARYRLYVKAPGIGKWGRPVESYIQTVRVRRRSLQRDIDVSKLLPGIVRGRVVVKGAPMRPGRIMVFARLMSKPSRLTYIRGIDFRGFVAEDGTFEFRCAAGKVQIHFVDATMNGVLFNAPDVVEVAYGKPVQVDYEVPLSRLLIQLRPEKPGQPVVVGQLDWEVLPVGVTSNRYRYSYYNAAYPGRPVDGRNLFVVSVPPGVAYIAVRSFANNLDPELSNLGYTPVATAEVKIEAMKTVRAVLEIPAPPQVGNQAEPPKPKPRGKGKGAAAGEGGETPK